METGSGDKDDDGDDEDLGGPSVPTEEEEGGDKNPIHKTEITTNKGNNGNDDGDDIDDGDDGGDDLSTTIGKDEYGQLVPKTDEDIPSKLKHFYCDFKSMRDSKQIRQKNYANHLQQKQYDFDFNFNIQFIRFIFPQLIFLYIIVRIIHVKKRRKIKCKTKIGAREMPLSKFNHQTLFSLFHRYDVCLCIHDTQYFFKFAIHFHSGVQKDMKCTQQFHN